MYDVEAGNPSITGKMIKHKKMITLKCDHSTLVFVKRNG